MMIKAFYIDYLSTSKNNQIKIEEVKWQVIEMMKEVILKELQEIEKKEQVKIIMAVESGSRAWGFESVDSDYDVRFIYVRKEASYLKLNEIRDVIEWKLDDTLDINGWDLKKALQLLYISNTTLFEWCNSPIVYLEKEELSNLKALLPQYFSCKKCLFHYWSIARKNYRKALKELDISLKRYLYMFRALFSAQWILEHQTPAPILFKELLDMNLDENCKAELEKLLMIKKVSPELKKIPKVQILDDYIEKKLTEIKEIADKTEDIKVEWDSLNDYFIHTLKSEE